MNNRNRSCKLEWPLSLADIERIHAAALHVLEHVGMSDPVPEVRDLAVAAGCRVSAQNRLCFPPALVEEAIAGTGRLPALYGRTPGQRIPLDGSRMLYGHSGIAGMVADFNTGDYRVATLLDLYDLNCLVDRLDNVPLGGLLVLPTEIKDPLECAINKVYAIAAGTTKPSIIDIADAALVAPVRRLLDIIAEEDGAAVDKPSFIIAEDCGISPLRFEIERSRAMIEAARHGFPVSAVVAPMAGSTGPAPLAGVLTQAVAEALASLVQIHLVKPGHPVFIGLWPFVADLRNASFSGGGGEQALLGAAAAQIVSWYGLQGSVAAGMTDAKVADAQFGYEKGITTTLAALGGGAVIAESVGMQASLLGASLEAMVIDDDMLGNVNRILRGIDVNDDTLSCGPIADAVLGSGNFLGHKQTRKYMRAEYVYPRLADRSSIQQWQKDGKPDIRARAREKVKELLSRHTPPRITEEADALIRKSFSIRLSREDMEASHGRW